MEKKNYELVVVTPVLDAKGSKKIQADVKSALEKGGAAKVAVKPWGIKEFAYPIGKNTKGSYWIYSFAAAAIETDKLNVFLNREQQILRYLLLRK